MIRPKPPLVILLVLVSVMIAVYATARRSSALSNERVQAQVSGEDPLTRSPRAGLPLPAQSVQRQAQHQRATVLTWNRDPFIRGSAIREISGLTLTGILWDAHEPLAIINGQMVHVGEEIEGYHIVDISRDRVSVTDDTQTFHLHITP